MKSHNMTELFSSHSFYLFFLRIENSTYLQLKRRTLSHQSNKLNVFSFNQGTTVTTTTTTTIF